MQTIELSGGRGWLAADAAASIARIDAQIGHMVQITEAGRSAEDADANYARWIAYQNGTGPKAPLALPASKSVHCQGGAVDSNERDAPWAVNGWIETARYSNPDWDEPWHREYRRDRDQHLNDPATITPTQSEEDDMPVFIEANNTITWANGYTDSYDPNVFQVLRWVAKGQTNEQWCIDIWVSEAWKAAAYMATFDASKIALPPQLSADEIAQKVAAALAPKV